MKTLAIKFIEKQIPYTGKDLRSHFIYDQFDFLGDALVAFAGPCEVTLDHMVDLEDVKLKRPIYSENMLHFLGEFYGIDLETTVVYQRLLMALMLEELRKRVSPSPQPMASPPWRASPSRGEGDRIFRSGDDLYEGEAKLSVSIATLSPVSTLIHAGVNISSKNTPVKTKGLDDFKIAAPEFAQSVLKKFQEEFQDISKAVCKVRSVL